MRSEFEALADVPKKNMYDVAEFYCKALLVQPCRCT